MRSTRGADGRAATPGRGALGTSAEIITPVRRRSSATTPSRTASSRSARERSVTSLASRAFASAGPSEENRAIARNHAPYRSGRHARPCHRRRSSMNRPPAIDEPTTRALSYAMRSARARRAAPRPSPWRDSGDRGRARRRRTAPPLPSFRLDQGPFGAECAPESRFDPLRADERVEERRAVAVREDERVLP